MKFINNLFLIKSDYFTGVLTIGVDFRLSIKKTIKIPLHFSHCLVQIIRGKKWAYMLITLVMI